MVTVFFWLALVAVPGILFVGLFVSPDAVSVNDVRITDPSRGQIIGAAAVNSGYAALVALGMHHLRKLTGSIRKGDPFTPSNVRHLQWMGLLLIIAPFAHIAASYVWSSVAGGGGVDVRLRFDAILVGLSILAISEVFAYGVRMREEVEGTV